MILDLEVDNQIQYMIAPAKAIPTPSGTIQEAVQAALDSVTSHNGHRDEHFFLLSFVQIERVGGSGKTCVSTIGVTQLEEAGSAGILPAPLLRIADSVERSRSTGSGGRFSVIGHYLAPQLRNSYTI